jgi:hypothetical protein
MSEREKQTRFLKELIRSQDSEECRALVTRLNKAEQDENCIRSAVRLICLLAGLSIAGLGYSAVFVPQFFHSATPWVVKFFTALVLASLICLTGFMGFYFWYRGICNRLCHECRNLIIALHKFEPTPPTPFPAAMVYKQGIPVYTIVTRPPEHEADIITLPQAS